VRSVSDRLGTIDLPCVFLGRAIVPNGSERRASGGVLGFRLLLAQATVRSGSDRLGTIDLPCVFFGRAIVPNGSTRRASGGVLRFSAVAPTWLRCAQAPIDWGQSIYHRSSLVEPLSLMARRGAQSAAYRGFRLLLSLATVRSGADRLGTIDLPCVFFGRAIVPNGSTRRARGGVSRFFGCCSHLATVRSGSDRLGTIDLP
jgi:hypothetical protein